MAGGRPPGDLASYYGQSSFPYTQAKSPQSHQHRPGERAPLPMPHRAQPSRETPFPWSRGPPESKVDLGRSAVSCALKIPNRLAVCANISI